MHKWAGYPPGTTSTVHFEFGDSLAPASDFCCAAFFDMHMHEHLALRFMHPLQLR